MPAVVMSSNTNSNIHHQDEEEWPSLGAAAAPKTKSTTLSSSNNNNTETEKEDSTSNNDWEMLPLDEQKNTSQEEAQHSSNSKTVSFDTKVEVRANPKLLRHSASSPDLRRYAGLAAVHEDEDDDNDDNDSFSLVSGVGSVISMSSATATGLSFRDAMLAAKATSTPQKAESGSAETKASTTPRRRPKAARFVVVSPIKRCAKSTGDLQSLVIDEGDEEYHGGGGGGGGGPILGETDAMDFYHRKAQGAKGRANGLKLRPDEAKRKNIIMYKKDMQRQKQQANAC